MQQNKYCDIQEHCKLLCEANKKYEEALKHIGIIELEKARLEHQISLLLLDKNFVKDTENKKSETKKTVQSDFGLYGYGTNFGE